MTTVKSYLRVNTKKKKMDLDLSDDFESSKYLKREIKPKIYFCKSTPILSRKLTSHQRQESFDSFLNINSFMDRLSTDSNQEIRKTNLKAIRNFNFNFNQKPMLIKKRSVKMSTIK